MSERVKERELEKVGERVRKGVMPSCQGERDGMIECEGGKESV